MSKEIFNLSKEDETTPVVFDLSKAMEEAGIPMPSTIRFGAGWDMPEGAAAMDVDLSIATVNADSKLVDQGAFAFFQQRSVPGIELSEDDRTGENTVGGDDEFAIVKLDELADGGVGVVGSLSVYDDPENRGLSAAGECYIRLVNEDTGEEMVRVQMTDLNSDAANLIKVMKDGDQITVEAVEEPIQGDLNAVVASFM
jgi:stress response protein SCP2